MMGLSRIWVIFLFLKFIILIIFFEGIYIYIYRIVFLLFSKDKKNYT